MEQFPKPTPRTGLALLFAIGSPLLASCADTTQAASGSFIIGIECSDGSNGVSVGQDMDGYVRISCDNKEGAPGVVERLAELPAGADAQTAGYDTIILVNITNGRIHPGDELRPRLSLLEGTGMVVPYSASAGSMPEPNVVALSHD